MAKFTVSQRVYIARKAKPKEMGVEDEAGELNIVPFLDIIMNILMFVLATITTVFTATIAVPAPSSANGPAQHSTEDPPITITVKVVREGYIVGAPGGFLQPGCQSVAAAALTVPVRGGVHDAAALTRCMETIRNHPEWGQQLRTRRDIQVAVNGDVPYHILVLTLDALRETRPGLRDMFTEPMLGIL